MTRGDGPFQVLERINDNAYKIDLPPEYQVHNTFNVCDLSRVGTVEDDNDPNLRKNSLQDGEDDTGIPSSRPFTRSQARANIVKRALRYPMKLIANNAGVNGSVVIEKATHFPTEMQIFGNLRMLALLFESTYDFDIVKVYPVLDACPVVQYLDILQHKTFGQKARGSHIRSPLSPADHTELKEVRFGGFHGTREEIELAIYILRSATVLDQMFLSQYSIGPYFKAYYGHDIWEKREDERILIQRKLVGLAISRSTVVIIQ
ncbi:hypothetical protein CQW23_05839 [Capsicum baccatum]|uniref:Uncharacterized protein n=1 Tax=Capsicum baccatum TaxID=33114 RepID=A0A2G2XIN4_CAPBA|nr:hypothetical protein CQW23_05839 [Capsicum baccatum]